MSNPIFFVGASYNYKNICNIYPPTTEEVIGNPKSSLYFKMLTFSEEEIEDSLKPKDDFTFEYLRNVPIEITDPFLNLIMVAEQKDEIRQILVESFYYFTHKIPVFLYQNKKIALIDRNKKMEIEDWQKINFLEQDNFFDFQNLIREAFGKPTLEPPKINEDFLVRKMKAQQRIRDRIKEKSKNKQSSLSLSSFMSGLCVANIGITPLNIREIPYCWINDLFTTYQRKEQYEKGFKRLLAGAKKSDVNLKYWIRDTEN